jgi:8-oxo-dGTP pyrophosphatase MutT (NUDIX family)
MGVRAEATPADDYDVARVVREYAPDDPSEAEVKVRFLSELARLERPFDVDADPTHVTASALVIGRRGVILHLHRRLGHWLQPGGHIEAGEAPADAARREVAEETGLATRHPAGGPQIVRVDVHQGAAGHTHLDLCFVLLAADADPHPGPGESASVRWFEWGEAETIAYAGLSNAIRSLRSRVEAGQFSGVMRSVASP